MLETLLPISTFLFILSSLVLLRFTFNLIISLFSNPPKKYEFGVYEPLLYLTILSYIITFLIYT